MATRPRPATSLRVLSLAAFVALLLPAASARADCPSNLGTVHVTINLDPDPGDAMLTVYPYYAGLGTYLNIPGLFPPAVIDGGGDICLPVGSWDLKVAGYSVVTDINGYGANGHGWGMSPESGLFDLGSATCVAQGNSTVCGGGGSVTMHLKEGFLEGTVFFNDEPFALVPVYAEANTPGFTGIWSVNADDAGHYRFTPQGLPVAQGWGSAGSGNFKLWAIDRANCLVSAGVTSGKMSPPVDIRCHSQPPLACPYCPPSPDVPRPVDVLNGNMWFEESDASVAGVAGLSFVRRYNSDNTARNYGGMFGRGWHSTYEASITSLNSKTLVLRGGNGSPIYYRDADGDQTYAATMPVDEPSSIQKTGTAYVRSFRIGGREEYSLAGKLTKIVDPSGNETTLDYDPQTRLTRITDPGGRYLAMTYEGAGTRPVGLYGPGGTLLATYGYDGQLLTGVTYGDGSGHLYTYDGALRITQVADRSGRIVERHAYDANGRATTSEIADGVEKYSIDYQDFKSIVTDALGNQTTYEWDRFHGAPLITRITGPCSSCSGGGGDVQSWTRDEAGRPLAFTDADGKATTYTYDAAGNKLTETNALSQTTTYTYDAQDRQLTRQGPDGSLTTSTYGPAGPLTITEKVTSSVNRTTTLTYTTAGKPQTITDPRSKVTTLAYNATGDLASVTDPLTHATSFGYDSQGRRTTVADALSQVTTTSYDARGRVSRTTSHDGTHTDFGYDQSGRRTSVTDPLGRVTRYTYDAYGRLEKVIDPLSQVTAYAYDLMSNLISLTDAKGQTTSFEYDGYARVKKVIYPGGAYETFTYDPAGRLATKIDRKSITTTYAYDDLGRLTGKTYSNGDPAVIYAYDLGGRLLTAANGTDSLTWTYDLAGQLLSEQSTRNASTVAYTYDDNGNRLSVSLDGTLFVSYAYDDASRLTSITRGGNVFGFGYDNANRRTTMTYPNGVNTTYTYDALNRLLRLKADKGATPITDFQYVYDAAGNRTRKQQLDYTEDYSYDALYRLIGVQRSAGLSGLWQYGYDPVGNRLYEQKDNGVTSYSYNEKNQLLSTTGGGPLRWRGTLDELGGVAITSALVNGKQARMLPGNVFEANVDMASGSNTVAVQATDVNGNVTTKNYSVNVTGSGATYSYDPNGNLTQKVQGANTWTYEWNAENELKRVLKDALEQARFSYDPVGRRVEKVGGTTATEFAYSAEGVLRETAGATTTRYVQGLGIDEPLASERSSTLTGLHADGLGSAITATDSAGVGAASARYLAFGALETAALGAYGFTGREPDVETGLTYYRARFYDGLVGRFIGEDPIGYDGGDTNLYAYVWNDPADFLDPTGLGAWKPPTPTPTPTPGPRSIIPPWPPGPLLAPLPPPETECLWSEYFDCLSTYYGHVASETLICTTGLRKRWGIPAMAGAGGCSLVGLYGLRELCIKKAFQQCGSCPPAKRPPARRPPSPGRSWSPDGRPPIRAGR